MFMSIFKAFVYVVVSLVVIRNLVVMIHNDNELQKRYAKEGVKY